MDFTRWCGSLCVLAGLLLTATPPAWSQSLSTKPKTGALVDPPLNMRVYDDVETLAVMGVPEVYVSGVIDSGSPARLQALMRSGKIPDGSIIYLNSPGGDLAAGLELGRLFRKAELLVYVGRPVVDGQEDESDSAAAICVSACAYAYFGGLYRFAPSGERQFGIHQFYMSDTHVGDVGAIQQASAQVVSYLEEMGINPNVFTVASLASRNEVVWITGAQMLQAGLANDGKLRLTASYKLLQGIPYLVLDQQAYDGEHKFTFVCGASVVELTSYYLVGNKRAKEIVSRGTRGYFEVDKRPMLAQEQGAARVLNLSVVADRVVPLSFLANVRGAASIGSWLNDLNGTHRYGFTIELNPVRQNLSDYYQNCAAMIHPSAPP